jgi:LPXTG-motif cell wall-anchored protein
MYNLVTAYREKMSLYRSIFITIPGPGQQIISEQQPAPAVDTSDQNTNIIYAIIGLVLCVLLIGIFRRKKPISQNL